MKTIYCLPIIKPSITEVIQTINKYPDYDVYEVWVDYIHDNLFSIFKKMENKLLFCFRRKNGEPIQMPFEKRKEIINNSIDKNILIDCDIKQQKEDLEYINSLPASRQRIINLIASYHNYKNTPNENELDKLVTTMKKYNPEIYKIAAYCQSPEDAVRLMRLLIQLKKQNKKAIVLGMGEYGKITRVFGALYGNEITFTPASNNEGSAQGQLTKEQMEIIIKFLIHNS